ncbi:hypothetical protein BASA81_018406 [Batrachochytrium salamandrivorans]|nr:hypothetical protein BASA81_018406 [Batrachochytrium salamandrivorans]
MPYGLQSDEDSQLASILERLQLLEAENASLKQSISQAQAQPQEAPQHIAPSTAPISPGAIRIPARQVQRKPAEAAHLSQPAGAGVSNQPQPIQLGGNQGGHSRDPLNRRGCVVVQSHPREPPRQPRHPQLLAGFQGPADQDIFSNGRHSPSSSRHSASDPRKWPREYLLFTVPAN